MIKGIGFLSLGLGIFLTVGSAKAGFVVYTNQATFNAALATESIETFDELGPTFQSFSSGLSRSQQVALSTRPVPVLPPATTRAMEPTSSVLPAIARPTESPWPFRPV